MSEEKIKPGDVVCHKERREEWVVAFADYETDRLAWCGWPEGYVKISDVELVTAVSEEESLDVLHRWATNKNQGDIRASYAYRTLYPEHAKGLHRGVKWEAVHDFLAWAREYGWELRPIDKIIPPPPRHDDALTALHLGVDLYKLEEERREMLDWEEKKVEKREGKI